MRKAEKFIQDYTRNCSNGILHSGKDSFTNIPQKGEYHPWLTPDQARKAVEIAREETIKEVCEWLDNHLIDYWSQSVTDGSGFIEDLKKHFESLEP